MTEFSILSPTVQATETMPFHLGADREEDSSLSFSAAAAKGSEVLISSAGKLGHSRGAVLTRRGALSELAFLIEPPHGIAIQMLEQVYSSESLRSALLVELLQ